MSSNLGIELYNARHETGDFTIISNEKTKYKVHKVVLKLNPVLNDILFNPENTNDADEWELDKTDYVIEIMLSILYNLYNIKFVDDWKYIFCGMEVTNFLQITEWDLQFADKLKEYFDIKISNYTNKLINFDSKSEKKYNTTIKKYGVSDDKLKKILLIAIIDEITDNSQEWLFEKLTE